MPIGIAAIQGADHIYEPRSTRTSTAESRADSAQLSSSKINVLLSSRLDGPAESFGAAVDRLGSESADTAGSSLRLDSSKEHYRASELRYSPTESAPVELGASDTIEEALVVMRQMGQDAVRAQANQLPIGAMPR